MTQQTCTKTKNKAHNSSNSFVTASEMTYTVSGGALNSTQSNPCRTIFHYKRLLYLHCWVISVNCIWVKSFSRSYCYTVWSQHI